MCISLSHQCCTHTHKQVRALEQQVAAMYDDVTLGDMDGAELTEVKQKEKSNLLRKRSSRKTQ